MKDSFNYNGYIFDPTLYCVEASIGPYRNTSRMSMSSTESIDRIKNETVAKETKKKKQYRCDRCSKIFNRPSALKTHNYTHTGEKPYSCSNHGCNRRFSVVSNLRRHLKVHKKPVSRQIISPDERERHVKELMAKTTDNFNFLNQCQTSHYIDVSSTIQYPANLQNEYRPMFRNSLYPMNNMIQYNHNFTEPSFWPPLYPLTRDINHTFYS